jgi:hypothetical protein
MTDHYGEMDAWAWRVLELHPEPLEKRPDLVRGHQLGEVWLNNRGIAGQRFVEALNEVGKERLTDAVKAEYEHLGHYTKWPTDARFYLRLLACANVAGRLAHHYGILAHAPEPYIDAIIAHLNQRALWSSREHIAHEQIMSMLCSSRRYTIDDRNPNSLLPGNGVHLRVIRERSIMAISTSFARRWCNKNHANYERMIADLGLSTELINLTEMDPGSSKAPVECIVFPIRFNTTSALAPTEQKVVPFPHARSTPPQNLRPPET